MPRDRLRTRPQGLIDRIEIARLQAAKIAKELDTVGQTAREHHHDQAGKTLRAIGRRIRKEDRELKQAVELLEGGTVPAHHELDVRENRRRGPRI